jgi:hypothetical protein
MNTVTKQLKQLEHKSNTARAYYDRLRAATTQAQNAMGAMLDVSKSADDPVLKAALQGYTHFSESMLKSLDTKLGEIKGVINQCGSQYGESVYSVKLGDRIRFTTPASSDSTVIEITEMGIDAELGADGVHKKVFVSGPRVGVKGNLLKRTTWVRLGTSGVAVVKFSKT